MATPRHVTDRLIQLHADGSDEAMKEVAKIHSSLEPKRQRSASASRSKSSSKSGASKSKGK